MKKIETTLTVKEHKAFRAYLTAKGLTATEFLRSKVNQVIKPKK
jgi:hypothetical protein